MGTTGGSVFPSPFLKKEKEWTALETQVAKPETLTGAIIVTTPHTLSISDAKRGITMFRQTGIEILGLVNNMSLFQCPGCGQMHHIFGDGNEVRKLCEDEKIDTMAELPLFPELGKDGRSGKPAIVAEPETERAKAFKVLVTKVAESMDLGTGNADYGRSSVSG